MPTTTAPRRPAIPKATAEAVLREFNHLCAICGAIKPHIHHIDEDNSNNDPVNLLPLCPNHHLTDQHDPTRKINPVLLGLFRQHKDPQMLSSRFEPIFSRLKPLLNITDASLAPILFQQFLDLADFVRHFSHGTYYADRIQQISKRISNAGSDYYEDDFIIFNPKEAVLARGTARDHVSAVVGMLVELLRYQDWPPVGKKD